MKLVLLGEGTGEPAAGIDLAASLLAGEPVTYFVGVRRSPEGLDALAAHNVGIITSMPGRGLARFGDRLSTRRLSSHGMQRSLAGGCITPDVMVVVATLPDGNGDRYLGTVNGHLQAAVDRSRLLIVEEDPSLPRIAGSARIRADRPKEVIAHRPLPYQALSRTPDATDFRIAEHVAGLITPRTPLQLGVGGAIDCLGKTLKAGHQLRIMTGAISASIRDLDQSGKLAADAQILGSALVGDDGLVDWATNNPRVQLLGSDKIHNPLWLARTPGLWSINVGISVDFAGNVNSERVGDRLVSGLGGAPNFASGAHRSRGGAVVVIIRADRTGALVERVVRPTICGRIVDFVVSERGVADLRGATGAVRRARLEDILG